MICKLIENLEKNTNITDKKADNFEKWKNIIKNEKMCWQIANANIY